MLSKKIEYIKANLLPEVLADTLEINHVAECSEEYYNKYNDMAINSQIGFVATYKNQEVLVNFFDGIGYKNGDRISKVTILKHVPDLSLANYWYSNDETFSTLQEVDDYRNSEEYLDNGDDVNVVMEIM